MHADSDIGEEAWSIEAPGNLLIEACADGLVVTRRGTEGQLRRSETAAIHGLLRDVATWMGLALFEPRPGFDAILTAPNGTVLLMQVKSGSMPLGSAIRAVTVRRDASPPTSTEISLTDLTRDSMAAQIRQVLSAA